MQGPWGRYVVGESEEQGRVVMDKGQRGNRLDPVGLWDFIGTSEFTLSESLESCLQRKGCLLSIFRE